MTDLEAQPENDSKHSTSEADTWALDWDRAMVGISANIRTLNRLASQREEPARSILTRALSKLRQAQEKLYIGPS